MMEAQRVASPTYSSRSLAGSKEGNLQTTSPWNPVRLSTGTRVRAARCSQSVGLRTPAASGLVLSPAGDRLAGSRRFCGQGCGDGCGAVGGCCLR
jgi:hypothetical protein